MTQDTGDNCRDAFHVQKKTTPCAPQLDAFPLLCIKAGQVTLHHSISSILRCTRKQALSKGCLKK